MLVVFLGQSRTSTILFPRQAETTFDLVPRQASKVNNEVFSHFPLLL